jgi:molecular chaperone HtpG
MSDVEGNQEQRLGFQAEVAKLLKIVANSLYADREVFLRELISNASDACDKRRHLALTEHALGVADGYQVTLSFDKDASTLTIADNGIGMNRDELVENLGTIAKSGTGAFLERLAEEGNKDTNLIGQFGVGFYAAFMVADQVDVLTRRAGDTQSWRWRSDGNGEFTIAPDATEIDGTGITLKMKKDATEYLDETRLGTVVRRYSDHIPLPIVLTRLSEDGDEPETQTLNKATALWWRSKSELTDEDYNGFYKHIGHDFSDPWMHVHIQAEGVLEYAALLYVPTRQPFDLFDPKRRHRVKLYVRRVFITEGAENLLPPYLRFLKGVVDSADLPLNISREVLQANPMVTRIKNGLVKRVLGDLGKRAENDPEGYATFWDQFGVVMKEGLHDDTARRDDLLPLLRCHSTVAEGDGVVSLKQYVERMRPGQEAIYYITGESLEAVRRSPQLEGFAAKGIEVLLLTDPVDEFWTVAIPEFDDKKLVSVTRGAADIGGIGAVADGKDGDKDADAKSDADANPDMAPLVSALKDALGDAVKDVRVSARLTESAVCLVADEGDMDINMERLLRQHKQLNQSVPRVLEVNAKHALIRALAAKAGGGLVEGQLNDAAHLLLDQARIIEGEPLADPVAFARRMASVMQHSLA